MPYGNGFAVVRLDGKCNGTALNGNATTRTETEKIRNGVDGKGIAKQRTDTPRNAEAVN